MSNLHGWLVLDKPLHMTSSQAVGRVKRLLNLPRKHKIGHAGTLDPLASGILPLAIGEATKTVTYCMDATKTYDFTLSWGETRTTDDAEGEVTATSAVRPTAEAIAAALPGFTGTIEQIPPAYSAIKVAGKRAYALARAGEEVTLASRRITIEELLLLAADCNEAHFRVTCSKGTYIRSLGRDLAENLGALAYVSALRRLKVGNFSEKSAISLEKLEEIGHKDAHASLLHPVESVLDDIPAQEITPPSARRLRQGQPLSIDSSSATSGLQEHVVKAMCEGELVAICKLRAGTMKPVRVFNDTV